MKRALRVDELDRIGVVNQPLGSKQLRESTSSLPSTCTSHLSVCHCRSCDQALKMSSPMPDPDYPEFEEEVVYGSIPRAHLTSQRPPLPIPQGGSPRVSSGSQDQHYYASAGTIKREVNALRSNDYYSAPYSSGSEIPAKRHAPQPPAMVPPYVSYNNSNPEYVSRVSNYIKETGKKHAARRDLEGLVAAIGFIGVILSLASLAAYLAVQAPYLRKAIGPAYAYDFHEDEDSAEVSRKLQTANVIYGVELACSIIMGLLLLLSDALLIHGVRKKSAAFLLPWLVVRAILLAILVAAFVLILRFVHPDAFKGFCILPAVILILVLLCWMKVFKLYKLTRNQFKPPKMKQMYSDYSHYSPEMTRESPYASSKAKKGVEQY